jgi:hypothetical protein
MDHMDPNEAIVVTVRRERERVEGGGDRGWKGERGSEGERERQ